VCDDFWDINDAMVVCRQLGYSSISPTPTSNARFGQGQGQIWLDYVQCDGNESSIHLCPHQRDGFYPCGHSEDAGVICSVVMCPTLLDPLNGNVLWTNFSVNGTATYTCNGGFELVGNEMRTCLSDGVWNNEEPVCTAIMCPTLPDPLNGNVLWTDLSVNSLATYTCNGGFELIGSEIRTCLSDGAWNKEEPVCTAIMCPTLLDPLNGSVFWTDLSVNSVAIYTCKSGFELIGSKVRSCLSDGVWSKEIPVCTAILCPVPVDPVNGTVVWIDRSVNSFATYTCTSGFELTGCEVRICQSDGVWSKEAPICTAIMCPTLLDPLNGSVMWTSLSVGSVASYRCNEGFELEESEMRICKDDGIWGGVDPVCTSTGQKPGSKSPLYISVVMPVSLAVLVLFSIIGIAAFVWRKKRKDRSHNLQGHSINVIDDVRYLQGGPGCRETAMEITSPQALYENISCGHVTSSQQKPRPTDDLPCEPLYANVSPL
jgi:CUB/sushi domain-containing protein